MHIRLAKEDDYVAIVSLMAELNECEPELTDENRAIFDRILASSEFRLLVADVDGVAVGTCYLNVIPNISNGGPAYAVIENVVTRDSVRRKGVGRSLLDRAVEMAFEEGCYKVMLLSGRTNPGVHEFYRRCGFDPKEKQAYIRRAP